MVTVVAITTKRVTYFVWCGLRPWPDLTNRRRKINWSKFCWTSSGLFLRTVIYIAVPIIRPYYKQPFWPSKNHELALTAKKSHGSEQVWLEGGLVWSTYLKTGYVAESVPWTKSFNAMLNFVKGNSILILLGMCLKICKPGTFWHCIKVSTNHLFH